MKGRIVDSKPTVDPDLVPLLDLIPPMNLSLESLPGIRGFLEAMSPASSERASLSHAEHSVPGPDGAPAVRVTVTQPAGPAAGPRPVLLWIHGGGYVIGRPEQNQGIIDDLADHLECVVVAPAYRLAPETSHPGPIEDCYAALQWFQPKDAARGIGRERRWWPRGVARPDGS